MDVPNSTPIWPSAAGPKVPDFHTKPQKTDRLDMDSALACLRRELVSLFVCLTLVFSTQTAILLKRINIL